MKATKPNLDVKYLSKILKDGRHKDGREQSVGNGINNRELGKLRIGKT